MNSRDLDTTDSLIMEERDKAREKVAATMIRLGIATGHGDTIDDLLSGLSSAYQDLEKELNWFRGEIAEMHAKFCKHMNDII